jgi:hypothetical protein
MRHLTRRHVLAAAACLLFAIFPSTARPQTKPADQPLRVLFIGNSLTYVNDLPKMLTTLAKAGHQQPIEYEQETPGGCTLEKHWTDGKALAKIQSHPWDIVILQEQSTNSYAKPDSFTQYAKKFDAEIKKQNAKTLLYMTWALQDKPETQADISKAYLNLAKEIHADVAPAGLAWQAALQADKTLTLHLDDKKHPQPAGTYLAACVFYATIYHQSPEGLPGSPAKLTDDQARPLQVLAWKIVQAQSAPATTTAPK